MVASPAGPVPSAPHRRAAVPQAGPSPETAEPRRPKPPAPTV